MLPVYQNATPNIPSPTKNSPPKMALVENPARIAFVSASFAYLPYLRDGRLQITLHQVGKDVHKSPQSADICILLYMCSYELN